MKSQHRFALWACAFLSVVAWSVLIWASFQLWARVFASSCGVECEPPNRFARSIPVLLFVPPLAFVSAAIGWTVLVGFATHRSRRVQIGVVAGTAICIVIVSGFCAAVLFFLAISSAPAALLWPIVIVGIVVPPGAAVFYLSKEAERRALVLGWHVRNIRG